MKKVLVIDVGGSHVKLLMENGFKRKFDSGPAMTPRQLMREVKKQSADLEFDAVSIGVPMPVLNGRCSAEPNNLGPGWVRFDFNTAFDKPVKLINDAAMQALGSYQGGRMLFLGLGTGLGSALIVDDVVVPLELGQLAYSRTRTLEDMLGKAGLKRLRRGRWEQTLHEVCERLKKAFVADYIVLGGGNSKRLSQLPPDTRLGHNDNAYLGGVRLWGKHQRAEPRKHTLEMKKSPAK